MSEIAPPPPPNATDAGTSQTLWANLQAQLRDLEYTIASLGTDDACHQALLELEQFETNLRAHLEHVTGNDSARDVLLSSADWIWETDAQGRCTYCSAGVMEVLGYTPEQILGKTVFDLMPPDEATRVSQAFAKMGASRQPLADLENYILSKDGHRMVLLTNVAPILDSRGNLVGYRGINRNITERKRIEESLKAAHDELQRRNQLLTQILEVGSSLHRNLNLDALLQDIVQAVHHSLRFGAVVLNLVDEGGNQVRVSAYAGLDDGGEHLLEGAVYEWEEFASLLQKRFRVGRCYFIPHSEFNWEHDFHGAVYSLADDGVTSDVLDDTWHVDDALLMPIELPHGQLVGIMSVDQPLDGRRPKPETLQALEIFANQAASAIENARLYEQAQQEIAERKRVEEDLVKFRLGIDRSDAAIFLTDVDGAIIYVNPAFEKIYGYSREEAIGKTPRILKSGVLPQEVYEEFWKTLLAKQIVTGELINKTKDGRLLNIEGSANPVLDKDGVLIGFLTIQRDTSERKRTEASLERRALQLQVAAEVARDVTSARDLDLLLNHAVNLVRDRFDFYHVGIFLVDEQDEYAILTDATGEAGREMLARGHKLKIGEVGIVGHVAASGEPRIALDVGADAVHFENPLLPGTRSEMALPLRAGERIIGALDVQSAEKAAFDEEDVAVLQTIADQLAVAIENARLLSETQSALQEVRSLHQHYLRQEWENYLGSRAGKRDVGYVLSQDGLVPAPQVWSPEIELDMENCQPVVRTDTNDARPSGPNGDSGGRASAQSGPTGESVVEVGSALAAPITLRGQVIGALDLFDPDRPRAWTDDDLALVDAVTSQVALAVENARLFEQTQEALSQTETLYQISRRIVTAADLPSLYQVIVDELAHWLMPDQCRLVMFDSDKGYGEVKAEYQPTPDVETVRIPMAGNPSYEILRDTQQPVAIEDVSTHPATAQVKDMFSELGIKSVLLVPLVVRGELVGSVGLDAVDRTRVFNESELEFCRTMASQAAIAIENMRAFEEQKEVAEQLREVDRLKTQFLANMSHELRTPLNSIIGFSRVIIKGIDGPLTEMQKTDLTAISNSGQHLLSLINNMLDLVKIEAGKMELSFEEVDLKPTIKGVMSSAVGLIKDKPIRLEQHVPDDLPIIWADSTRLRQVLLNLISNAAKFTEKGKITLTAGCTEEWITIQVTDTGIGVPQEKLEGIFEEFTQVDASTTRRSGGTGLGLPISRHFVELHGGKITVESQVGAGSTFTVTLPIHPEMKQLVQATTHEKKDEDESPGTDYRLVLAVDDDPGVISLYKRYLDGEGYQVIGITSGHDVIEKAKELSPYAITLDVLMPGKDGWQVLRDLKDCPQTSSIPIIICSIVHDERRGFSLGAIDYLVKPIVEDELLAALSRLDHPRTKHLEREEPEVLVIDDHVDDILLIRRILEGQHGYRVIEASGGKAGIDLVIQRQPDIIILDLMMPEVDGFAVLEAIKREPETRTIPVIVVTAKELTEEERQRIDGQVEVLLRKGLFTEHELLEGVAKALDRVECRQSE